jgi:hypothetical protein
LFAPSAALRVQRAAIAWGLSPFSRSGKDGLSLLRRFYFLFTLFSFWRRSLIFLGVHKKMTTRGPSAGFATFQSY